MSGGDAFLSYLDEWFARLAPLPLRQVAERPGGVALLSVDLTNGFCYEGPLASPRVRAPQDPHEPDAVEFGAYPPHCVRGTSEPETIPEIKALPFYDRMLTLEKNSIDSSMNTGLNAWIDGHPEVDRYLIVGDCTDLCVYQLAMHLRLDANARQL